MAGMTDTAFRRLVKRRGGCGLVVTEMVSAEGLVRGIDVASDGPQIREGEPVDTVPLSEIELRVEVEACIASFEPDKFDLKATAGYFKSDSEEDRQKLLLLCSTVIEETQEELSRNRRLLKNWQNRG